MSEKHNKNSMVGVNELQIYHYYYYLFGIKNGIYSFFAMGINVSSFLNVHPMILHDSKTLL